VVALLVLALLVAMAAAVGRPDPASGPVRLGPSTGSYYNPVAPRLERTGSERERLGTLEPRPAGARGSTSRRPAPTGDEQGRPPVEDLSFGVEFVLRRVAGNNRWVVIGVRAAPAEDVP
jgi:hypothetical protein